MSTTIDERIVQMDFDGSGLESGANKAISVLENLENALKLDGATNGIENVKSAVSGFNAAPMVQGIEKIKESFSAMETFVGAIVFRLGQKFADFAVDVAKKLYRGLTAPIGDGFKEYEAQMKSVQTISANSGESLEVIERNLDELNEYADKTVYVFSDMTSAIGRFTAAGLGVEESTRAIQGFFNAAALSGADAQAASRGVYQLSQAMSAGVVRLQDWKSIENASIDTESFRRIIMLTADQMGITEEKFLRARDGSMSFRESLSGNWLTAEVMQKALENLTMSTMDFEDAEAGAAELMKRLTEQGYGEKQAKEIIAIATAADQSAREVRTWSQLMDTARESMGSGWATTWKLIIGNYQQSAEFFTWLSKKFDGIISASADARNGLLKDWQDSGGRDALIGIVANSIEAIERIVSPVIDALGEVFKITGERLAVVTENIAYFTEGLVIGGEEMTFINSVFFDLFSIVKSVIGVLGNGARMLASLLSGVAKLAMPFIEVAAKMFAAVAGQVAKFAHSMHVVSDVIEELFSLFVSSFAAPIEFIVRYVIGYLSDLREAFLWVLPQTEFGKRLSAIKARVVDFLSSLGVIEKFKNIISKLRTPLTAVADFLKNAGEEGRLDQFKQFFLDVSGAIERRFSPAIGLLKAGFSGIIELAKPVVEAFKKIYDLVSSFSIGGFSGISEFVSNEFSSVLDWFSGFKLPSISEMFNQLFSVTLSGPEGFTTKPITIADKILVAWEEICSRVIDLKEQFSENGGFGAILGNEIFSNVRDAVLDLRDRFLELIANADLSTESIKNFVIQLGTKVTTRGSGVITTVVTSISSAFSKLLEYAKSFRGKNLSLGQIVSTVFSDAYHSLKRWLDSIAEKSEGFRAVLAELASTILDKIGVIPSLLANFFGIAKDATDAGIQNLTTSAEEFRNNAENFWTSLFEKLPSLSDIGKMVSDFVGQIKRMFLGEVKEVVDSDVLQEASVFSGFFNLSRFDWVLPDWKTPVEQFIADFASVLDLVPDDRINELIDGFVGWAKKLGGIAFAFSGWKWLGSLTRLNEAKAAKEGSLAQLLTSGPANMESIFANIGKNFAHGLFEPFKTGLTNIGTAIRDFGKYFDPLGKKSKGKQFRQVAEGILLLAAALFTISKIPADDLERSGMALLKLGAASAVLMLVIGVFVALGKMDLTGVGAAFGGLGVGLLAMSAALYVLCKLLSDPELNIEDAYIKLLELAGVITLATVLISLSTQGGNPAGAAAVLLAFGTAILLMLAPLYILAKISENTFLEGLWKMAILASLLTVCTFMISSLSTLGSVGGAAVLLALIAALTLAIIPLAILSAVPEDMYLTGLRHMMIIGLLLTALAGIMSIAAVNVVGIAVGTAALFALIAALTLAVIPIFVLGSIPTETLKKGELAVAGIALILALFGAAMGAIGTFLPGIVVGSAALLLMDVAVALMAIVISGLAVVAALNPDAFATALIGLIAIAVSFAILAAALGTIGPMIAVASAALIGMVVAVGLMAALVAALAYLMDLHPEAMVQGVTALAVIVAILAGIGIAGAVSGVGFVILAAGITAISVSLIALSGAIALLKSIVDFSFLNGLFASFNSAGSNIGEGLQAGIAGSEQGVYNAITGLASRLFEGFCSWLGIQSPSTVMEGAGGDVVQGLINGIVGSEDGAFDASQLLGEGTVDGLLEGFGLHMSDIENLGTEGSSSFLDRFSDLPSQLGEKASVALEEFLAEFDTEELEQKGADLVAGLINGIMDNLGQKMSDAASGVFHGFADPILNFFGIQSPSTYMRDMVGANIVQGLIEGISNLGNLSEKAAGLGQAITDAVVNLPETMGTLGQNIVSFFTGGISRNSGMAKSKAQAVVDSTTSGFDGLGGKVSKQAVSAMTKFNTSIKVAGTASKTQMVAIVNSLGNAVNGLSTALKSKASQAMSSFSAALRSGTSSAKSAVTGVMNAAAGAITSLYSKFHSSGKNAVRGLVEGIDALLPVAKRKAQELMDTAIKAAQAKAKIKSPSRVFMAMGGYMVEGLVIGIDNLMGDAANAGSDLSGNVIDSFGNSLNGMAIGMDDLLDADYNPVITPVINPAEFDSNLNQLAYMLNNRLAGNLDVGSVNYNETFAGKLDAVADINKQAMQQFAENAIDYDRLGVSVANALIRSGVHVEMDGGQLMGYLAGEIRDVRRMYG